MNVSADGDVIDPVSHVLETTDVWFGHKVQELETAARDFAASHAAAGQPRHDVAHTAPLEVEILLVKRGDEILQSWADRIRAKMRAAIELEVESLYTALSECRQAVADASRARRTLESTREETDLHLRAPVIAITRHLEPWIAGVLLCLLIGADFFANLPVFVELMPGNTQSASALVDWEAQQLAAGLSTTYGLRRLVQSLATNPEPALLGLSVIVFFLVLGHNAGRYLRQAVVLSPSPAMRSHFRQAIVPLGVCAAGILLTVSFLFSARATVQPLAEQRLGRADKTLADVNGEIDAANTQGAEISPVTFQRQAAADAERTYRRDRLDYGSTLAAVNVPILFLNIVLVLAAAIIGYATAKGHFSSDEKDCEAGEIERLVERRNAAHEALRKAERALARIRHVAGADLLKDLEAKKARISCAVPLFRTENARLRGLDVADVLAFRAAPPVRLPSADELGMRLEAPPEVAELEAATEHVRRAVYELDIIAAARDADRTDVCASLS